MSLTLGALEDALIEAGATKESARKASSEVAAYENALAEIKSDVKVIKFSQILVLGMLVSLIMKTFFG